eukprot:97627-Amphidinium_carterae.1
MPPGGDFAAADHAVQSFWRSCIQEARVFARVSPEEKVAIVRAYRYFSGQPVAMIGDGLNDAPALMQADVGICMAGLESDAVKDASGLYSLSNDLRKIAKWIGRSSASRSRCVVS